MPEFGWDPQKAEANRRKHGISFETATRAWPGKLRLLNGGCTMMEISREQREELERLAAMPDTQIDTSDIPEVVDWRGAIRGVKPTRRMRLAAMLDNDTVEWFEQRHAEARDCAAEINRVLQDYIAAETARQR